MDPITIHVEVGLKEATIQSLKNVFTACIGGAAPARPALPEKPVEAPKVEAAAPAPEAPGSEAPAVDNMTLNAAVKAAQGRGVPSDQIRLVFAKYGIEKSRDCAADKRSALLSDLNAL